ncbi:MAG: response regulator [Deltaproteobacteria bacterium]|nr:response regulator [Deltaproteobacteria bacterium]
MLEEARAPRGRVHAELVGKRNMIAAQPLRVLVVEDSQDDFLVLEREIRSGGYEPVCERVDTAEALGDALAAWRWDLVISDYTMPGFSGTTALEMVRGSRIDVPFIFLSGTLGEEAAVAAMKVGAHDYIVKGNVRRLLPAIERELREAESRRQKREAEENVRRQQAQLGALHEINLAITSTLDLRGVLNGLLEKVDDLLPYPVALTVRLLDEVSGELRPVACRNLDEVEWGGNGWGSGGRGLSRLVAETRAPLVIRELQKNRGILDPDFFRKHRLVSYVGVPLTAKDKVLGVIGFYSREAHDFTAEELEFFMTLAGQAAVAIQNSQLYEQSKLHATDLERVNRATSEFVSFMSHELRTPLSTIMGYAGMIQERVLGEINPEQETAVAKIQRYGNEMLTMINSILEAGRSAVKDVPVAWEDVDLIQFFEELQSPYRVPLGKEVTLVWEFSPRLPGLRTDAKKLTHILQNLINNAIKFTEQGEVRITARHDPTAKVMEFKVADTGRGIQKEFLTKVFEMFQQAGTAGTRLNGGVGLGLYMAKKFAELLGGKIEVWSEPGKGSTFTVSIPCAS